jgi:hypothetical protein
MKNIKKTLFAVMVVVLFFTGAIWAKKIAKEAAPQNIGFKDVAFNDLTQGACRGCHGESLADRHHGTKNAASGNCVFCHKVSTDAKNQGVDLTRDCLKCHLKSPHHLTEAAKKNKCGECHDTPGLSAYSTQMPNYAPSLITPSKNSCKNCHIDGNNGKDKIFGFKETHHGTGIQTCETCHAENKASDDVRLCERCHNVASLHQVKPHIEGNACFGCHGEKLVKKAEPAAIKKKGRK